MAVKILKNNKTLGFFKWLFTRNAILYALIVICTAWLVDFSKVDSGLKMRVLTYMMPPSFDYMAELMEEGEKADPDKLKDYKIFYERVVEYIPERPDGYDFLAFCYWRLGKASKAVSLWEKSAEINPGFFWSNFNLGKFYYGQKNYAKAIPYFTAAYKTDLNGTHRLTINPKSLYSLVLEKSKKGKEIDVVKRLIGAYAQNLEFLILSNLAEGEYAKVFQYALWGIKSKLPFKDKYYFYAGVAAYQSHDLEKALGFFKTAWTLAPSDRLVLLGYLNILLKMKKTEDAKAVLSQTDGVVELEDIETQWESYDPLERIKNFDITPF